MVRMTFEVHELGEERQQYYTKVKYIKQVPHVPVHECMCMRACAHMCMLAFQCNSRTASGTVIIKRGAFEGGIQTGLGCIR